MIRCICVNDDPTTVAVVSLQVLIYCGTVVVLDEFTCCDHTFLTLVNGLTSTYVTILAH